MKEPRTLAAFAAAARKEQATLDAELVEIEMLVQQARSEAARHEGRRTASADRLSALGKSGNAVEVADISGQLITLTRRAAVMQAQVDVLEGKLKTLVRYRDWAARTVEQLEALAALPGAGLLGELGSAGEEGSDAAAEAPDMPPAISRLVLSAQEDLRREIARTMHDGPAQSLTNIVLQAQIVDRLITLDPASAHGEVRQLIAMVQQTLDATKSFIFDVRPMVLDDLGLVPTIRRAARERGRRAQIPVEFESFGGDRRMPMEIESGVFRIIDETLAAYLAGRPDRVFVRLDWADGLEVRVAAPRDSPSTAEPAPPPPAAAGGRGRRRGRGSKATPEVMPPVLAAMIEDQLATETAARKVIGTLPAATRREVMQRAATLGIAVELADDGREVRLFIDPAATA